MHLTDLATAYASLRKISRLIYVCLLTKSENEIMTEQNEAAKVAVRMLSVTCVTIKLNYRPLPTCGNAENGIWLTCKLAQSIYTHGCIRLGLVL